MTRTELAETLLDLAEQALAQPETVTAGGVLIALSGALAYGTEEQLMQAIVPFCVELQRKAEQDKAQNN